MVRGKLKSCDRVNITFWVTVGYRHHHDWFSAILTFGLCCGLVISYVPQHYRIISSGSSEGLSPIFLFLGVTSATSGLLNMITVQWGILRCCPVLSIGSCIEMTAGIIQVGLQWAMFSLIMILYMIYYPPHLKFLSPSPPSSSSSSSMSSIDTDANRASLESQPLITPRVVPKGKTRTRQWQTSVVLSWLAVIHFLITFLTTLFLLLTFPPSPSPFPSPNPNPSPIPSPSPTTPTRSKPVTQWALFLGLTSAVLCSLQYLPQILLTYRSKLVGALSIPMMCIQTPGAVLMVTSIAVREGTDWTSWGTFAVAGICQGVLLVMCLVWRRRQRKLGIDDFGNSVKGGGRGRGGRNDDDDALSIASEGRDSGIGEMDWEERRSVGDSVIGGEKGR
ncbi:hypothetical protein K435DRAFT_809104 [Dendrothele bispora CBS 962.96]|uniref:PQ-loop-domain-containing protein n=1 Tax=Dendrothele bispora (strain CBS 962.96) TaxID=1314807 RepID=A0A4S8KZA3_DENBC|nr:hypothetical protein K435DRAFT_809104 [Dendrothele bispora CBS 962.96]